MTFRTLLVSLLALAFVGATAGCGDGRPPFYKVEGLVTYEGEPLPEATLTFQRIEGEQMEFARPSICISGPDGTFKPWTFREGDGLPAGRYRVGVMAQEQVGGPPIRPDMTDAEYNRIQWKSIIPTKYNDTKTSGIEVEVGPDGMVPSEIKLTADANTGG